MRLNRLRQLHHMQIQRGMSLVELMVVLVIGMLILLALFLLLFGTKQAYTAESGVAILQDRQRMAFAMLNGVIQTAGYYPNPVAQTNLAALPAAGAYGSAGQAVFGSAGSGTSPDTVQVRFQTAGGDPIVNCQGGTNTDGTNHTYDNVFSISNDALVCALGIDGNTPGTPVTLVPGVSNLKVLFGYDPAGSGAPVQYVPAGSVATWQYVYSVKVTLTFANPMAGQAGQPSTVDATQIIQLMGQ